MRPPRALLLLGAAAAMLLASGCLAPAGSGNAAMGGLRGYVTAKPRAGTEAIYSPPPPPPPPEPPPDPSGKKKKKEVQIWIPPPPPFPLLDYASLRDIVVWAEPARGAGRPTKEEAEDPAAHLVPGGLTEQETLEVEGDRSRGGPRAIPVDGILKIVNFSDEERTFFSVSPGNEFDTGPLRPGETYDWRPQAPGVVDLLCDERAGWRHSLAVVPTLRHAQITSGRSFDFNDLPVGVYKLTIWHWRLPLQEMIVEVRSGEWTRVDVTLSVDQIAGGASTPQPPPRRR